MYVDWDIRKIETDEYLNWFKSYCSEFPRNTLGMAAHTFTFRVKNVINDSVSKLAPELGANSPLQQPTVQTGQQRDWTNVHAAYYNDKMTPEHKTAYEQGVKSGEIPAPIVPNDIYDAYVNGKMSAEDRKVFEQDIESGMMKLGEGQDIQVPSVEMRHYSCVIKDAIQVANNGKFEIDKLAKHKLGQRFSISILTGDMTGFLASGWHAASSITVLDFGSKEQAFKAIAISKPNIHVQYLEINEYMSGDEKPFKIVSYLDVLSGMCEKK